MNQCVPSRFARARSLALLLTLALGLGAGAQPPAPTAPAYPSDFKTVQRLADELYEALPREQQSKLGHPPLVLREAAGPLVQPVAVGATNGQPPCAVIAVSGGFLDLVNRVAHAEAIDHVAKGCLAAYAARLASDAPQLPALPEAAEPRFQTENLLETQQSHFNQMAGTLVAIDLAHHYLGHYEKYAARLTTADGQWVPINQVLTLQEWKAAVTAGVKNSLNCGLGTEGVCLLYECIDRMPHRPAWTAYFLFEAAKVRQVKRELSRLEEKFFSQTRDPRCGDGSLLALDDSAPAAATLAQGRRVAE